MRVIQYAGARVAGGLTRHVEILVRGLVASGHQVRVILSPSAGVDAAASTCAATGASVTRLAVKGKSDIGGLVRFRNLVAREKPDLLHVHLSSPVEAIPALMAARWSGVGHLITTEHAPTWFPLERFYSRAAKRMAGRAVEAVIALCRADARFLEERFGVPAARITVIPNGVPPPSEPAVARDVARANLGLPVTGWPVVGYAGALERKKGLLDLVEAATGLAGGGLTGLAVALAGAGALEPELRRRSGSLPFGLVLCGQVADIGPFLAALDLFALPSHQEAMPLALLEAMASGLPVVATRVGGVPEAIEDGVTGLLVEPARPAELAAALLRLARDGELRRGLGEAARAVARERFDAGLMIRRIETLYGVVVAGSADRQVIR